MAIDTNMLAHIIATHGFNNYITFQSQEGDMNIYNLIQSTQMPLAQTIGLQFITESSIKDIFFKIGVTTVRKINLNSGGNVNVEYDLTTTFGDLEMTYGSDVMISSGVDFTSNQGMKFTGITMNILGQSLWNANEDIVIDTSIDVTNGDKFTVIFFSTTNWQ